MFLFGPRQDLKLHVEFVFLIHRFKKGDRSHIRCYVCNKFCTGVAVPIIRHSVSLHTYPQVHALWACRMCEWSDRRPQMMFYIKYQPSYGLDYRRFINRRFKQKHDPKHICSCSLDTNALVVETVWVIVTYIAVTLTPMPLWSRRCGLHKYQP